MHCGLKALQGQTRAVFGKKRLPILADAMTSEFGKSFDATDLRHMRGFYLIFPMRNAVRRGSSWPHYRTLLRVDNEAARHWYMNEAAMQNWRSRALDHQIGTLYYESLSLSDEKDTAVAEARAASVEKAESHAVQNTRDEDVE